MSYYLEMLQVARLSPTLLGDSAALVIDFLLRRQNPDGGFAGRHDRSDLYYTVFSLSALAALRAPLPAEAVRAFLHARGRAAPEDLVGATSLARCWVCLGETAPAGARDGVLAVVEAHRAADGGFHHAVRGAKRGSAYGCYLALGAFQDLRSASPPAGPVAACVESLRARDGGYANVPDVPFSTTTSTAAAEAVLRHLQRPPDEGVAAWLLARHYAKGGFFAADGAPMPDLLSTATALHALAGLQVPLRTVRDTCLDFLDSLWSNKGGFCGSWGDDTMDSEYTFYALLALGHLSVA